MRSILFAFVHYLLLLIPILGRLPSIQAKDIHITQSQPETHSITRKEMQSDPGEQIIVKGTFRGYPSANGYIGKQAGGGLIRPEDSVRSLSSVSSDFIHKQAPTSNVYNLISLLPGANVSGSDPFGLATQTDMTVRGMTSDSIGYVLEGMPLNDVSDGGGYLNQFVDMENLESVGLSQGSPDLDSPVFNAAGGIVNIKFREPSDHMGGMTQFSYGSYHTGKIFARMDTGKIGKTGIKGFISYSYTDGDNWRGAGYDHRQHVDFKFTKEWGSDNRVSLLGNWNRSLMSSYYTPTKHEWKMNGIKNGNNYSGTWYHNGIDNSNYWKLYQQTFQQIYLATPGQFTLTDKLQFTVTPYFQYGYGNTPYGAMLSDHGLWQGTLPVEGSVSIPGAVNGQGMVMGDWFQRTYRSGFTPELHLRLKHHHLYLGYWYDYSDNLINEPFTPVSENGKPWDLWGGKGKTIRLPDGQPLYARDTSIITQVNAVFIGDRMNFLHNKLHIDVGFKQVMLSQAGYNRIPGPQYRTGNNVAKPLPRIGMVYQFTKEHQLFVSASTNFSVPHQSTLFDTYDPNSGTLTKKGTNHLKTEYSIEEEIGYRYNGPRLVGSVTFFNYNYTNRMIKTVLRQNNAWIGSSINAGGQTSRGIDAELGLKPWHHFSPYISGEYLNATMDNDFKTRGDYLPTRGKKAVRSPSWQFAVGLTYDDGHFFANGNMKMVGKQYATFMNDEAMGSYATGNLALGYRFDSISFAKYPEIRLNFINITDQKHLSGIGTPTSNAHNTVGKNGTVIKGSSPYYNIGGGFATMLTLTSAL